MPWAAGIYTKWNGSGGWASDAAANIGIEAGRHDTQDTDFQDGINACLAKNGSNSATGNLNLGNNKLTNIATGTLSQDAVNLAQVQAGINIQSAAPNYSISRFSADSSGAQITLQKSRNSVVGSNTIVNNGDTIGILDFAGADGSTYTSATRISAIIDAAPGATNDMPGAMLFSTTPDGSGTPVERMRITNAGYLCVGTSTAQALCTVRTASTTLVPLVARVGVSSALSTPAAFFAKEDNDNTTSNVYIRFLYNAYANGNGQINGNGSNQAAFGSYSDIRLKENVTDLPSQFAALLALRPVEFDYKDNSGHQLGFIAQEVEEIYPDLVSEADDGMKMLTGLGKNEARLIKGFQELAAKVKELEDRIAILEA